MATATKKRTMSPAQKRALAKGRAALKRKRAGTKKRKSPARKKTTARKTVRKRTTVRKKGNPTMAKRKKRRGGFRRKARRTYKRARGFLSKQGDVMNILRDAALAVGGGVAAGIVSNQLPLPDPRLKSAAPIVAGVILATTIGRKNELVRGVANGMVVLGAVSLAKQLMPNIPMIAGEDDLLYLPDEDETALLGYDEMDPDELEELTGESVELGTSYVSPADL